MVRREHGELFDRIVTRGSYKIEIMVDRCFVLPFMGLSQGTSLILILMMFCLSFLDFLLCYAFLFIVRCLIVCARVCWSWTTYKFSARAFIHPAFGQGTTSDNVQLLLLALMSSLFPLHLLIMSGYLLLLILLWIQMLGSAQFILLFTWRLN